MTTTFPRTMGYGLGSSLQRGASAFGPWVTSDPYDYPLRDQTMTSAPSFPPFKFESRRARIDWRLLHGVDINAMMRDVDLDTLEKIVNIVAFGDIEAEDTRHLTELNFIKIFRLSQMMIEYLLYVQDCLQSSNTWLQQDRGNMDKYVHAARLRIRELEVNLKMSKRELRRSRKTIKTYELLAVFNDGKSTLASTMPSTATVTATAPPQPPSQPQAVKTEPNPVNLAMEALLRKELAVLGERLSKATLECQTLRTERDELYQAVKDLEATVKARSHLSGASSPITYSRQNAEALQMMQGLQDQLNKATVEVTKLRNEREDLSEELDRANAERRQLQDEKSRLLSELASRPTDLPAGVTESPRASENLSSMLLEADRQKAALQDQLADAKAEITALQKQLMKAMKATALGALPSSQQPDDRLVRELESAKAQLDKELADLRRTYNEDVRQLQEELEAMQAKAVEAEQRIAELRAAQRDGAAGMNPPQTGGFVKVVAERRAQPDDTEDHGADRQRAVLAEYEATNDRLNEQLIQLKSERNTLAGEVEQLRLQLQNRASPPPGDRSIGRDWRTEEMERLKEERDAMQRRALDLEDALRDRDALIERLRNTIRDLQAQLEERNRQPASPDGGPSLVQKQVKHFERLADPAKMQSSFSFTGDSPTALGSSSVETPTSVQKPTLPGVRPRSPLSPTPSPPPTIPEEPEVTPAGSLPPAPNQPVQRQDPSQASRWLRRIPRPNLAQAAAIQQQVMRHVAGMVPEAMDRMIQDEIRVITENPYEFAGDDDERFRAMLRYEMAERKGVLSVAKHNLEGLATARSMFTDQLLGALDDELAQYGVDPTGTALSDKAYLACMQELSVRRRRLLERYSREVQDRAEDLRSFLLTHLEVEKRQSEKQRRLQQQTELQQQVQQQKQQQQEQQQQQKQQQQASATGRDSRAGGQDEERKETQEKELEPDAAVEPPAAATYPLTITTAVASSSEPTRTASMAPVQGLAEAAEAATKPLSAGGTGPVTVSAAGAPVQRQLASFPSRQTSQRSSAGGADAGMEELSSMLPPAPKGSSSRPASETTQQQLGPALLRRSTPGQGRGAGEGGGSTHLSRETSATELQGSVSRDPGDAAEQRPTAVTQLGRSSSGASDDLASRSNQSPQRSGNFAWSQPLAAAGPAQAPTPVMLTRHVAPSSPERITLGHAKPTQMPRPAAAAATASTPGGNMNMSIRSVKYQESDFDDDEDELPLPQPKPVRRLADDDEYALTEDEEAQQDMGIEDSEDFSTGARPTKILMAPGGSPPRTVGPSRLGTQPPVQARGWATDEPLQPPPAKAKASPPASEAAEVGMLDSIQSFDNTNSHSMKRSPGAWGSPSSTTRKPAVQSGRDPSIQMSVASKHSGWNETIRSFTAASGTGDEVQAIHDITESTESVRPIGRLMGQRGPIGPTGASQAPGPRIIPRRGSFSSDLSEIEYA